MSFAPQEKELQNYETWSFYGAAGTPAILPLRETFAPEYKQILSGDVLHSALYHHSGT